MVQVTESRYLESFFKLNVNMCLNSIFVKQSNYFCRVYTTNFSDQIGCGYGCFFKGLSTFQMWLETNKCRKALHFDFVSVHELALNLFVLRFRNELARSLTNGNIFLV